MKNIIMGSIAMVVLLTAAAFGQMGGGAMGGMQNGGMGSQQPMSQNMMQNMTGMMKHMNEMMQKLSHPMGHMTVTEHAKFQDMAKIMREMATSMTELAAHMDKGKMDQATAVTMREKMNVLNKNLEALEKKRQ